MINLSPKALLQNANGIWGLLAVLGKPEVAGELLRDLTDQAERAIEAQDAVVKLEAANRETKTLLDAHAVGLAKRDQSLNDLQARLDEARRQHQFRMQSEQNALEQTRADHEHAVKEHNRELEQERSALRVRSRELDAKMRKFDELSDKLLKWQATLEQREQALETREAEHAAKVARLKELAA